MVDAQTPPDAIWLNARLATFAADQPGIGAIDYGALAARDGRLVFVGAEADVPAAWRDGAPTIDCGGRWITPGLVDCHTHLVFAGDRAHEFELRLAGASYETIAREGGGIAATVAATRAASEDELMRQTLPRLDALIAEGVTTVEIKSGYGLELAAERHMLRAARRLAIERPIARANHIPRRPRHPAGVRPRSRRLPQPGNRRNAAGARRRGTGRRGRRILRIHCLQPRRDRAPVRRGARARVEGQAARRPVDQQRRRGARRGVRRAVGRSSRIHRRRRRRGDGAGRGRRRAAARRLLHLAPAATAASRSVPPARRGDGGGDRLQSGHLPAHLARCWRSIWRRPCSASRSRNA